MGKTHNYCIILTTYPDLREAKSLASLLIRSRLAACIQITDITSCYEWEGTLKTDTEHLLSIKTRSENYVEIEGVILQNHPYEIPEIIQVPITEGYERYLQWIDDACSVHGEN
jgi:periplasmic divalent cation tolerance protein